MTHKRIVFTDRSTKGVDAFLKEISKEKPLSTEEEHRLWLLMRKGDMLARERLIRANMRYVVTKAKEFLPSHCELADLIMAGELGLVKAADNFDARLGNRFITYATWYIESEIQKAANDYKKHNCAVKLDETMFADEDGSESRADYTEQTTFQAPDAEMRYDDMLEMIKKGIDKMFYQGAGELVTDFVTMKMKGYTTTDFKRKHHLSDRQMERFLDGLRDEGRKALRAAA